MTVYITLCELLHSTSVVFLCVVCVRMSIHTPTGMSCVPISSFHHSEKTVRVSGCCRLYIYPTMVFYAVILVMYLFLAVVWGILCCCYYKDLIMQTTVVGVWVCRCVCLCGGGGAVHVCILESECTDECKCVLVPLHAPSAVASMLCVCC